jgi:proteasome lid subunit RPN8/RPN11
MKWVDQAEPERTEEPSSLQERCGLGTILELLVLAQTHNVCVWFDDAVRTAIYSYLAGHAVEAGGLLLGRRVGVAAPGTIVSIESFVPSTDFDGTGVSLTMGTKVWDDARPHLDAGYVVVGWVHSHPNLGAFFSGTDRKTQRAFFAKPWQVGLCVDPVRGQSAWFFGPESSSEGLIVVPLPATSHLGKGTMPPAVS